MKDSRGFSLLELLIVVAIILIIATIAIPNLIRARQVANETGAVANLRVINTAQITFFSGSGNYGTIEELVADGLLDTRFSSGAVQGYDYTITDTPDTYVATAAASSSNAGRFSYFSGPDNIVRYAEGEDVTPGEPVQ